MSLKLIDIPIVLLERGGERMRAITTRNEIEIRHVGGTRGGFE